MMAQRVLLAARAAPKAVCRGKATAAAPASAAPSMVSSLLKGKLSFAPGHFKVTAPMSRFTKDTGDYMLPHAIYTDAEARSVQQTHSAPGGFRDRAALAVIRALRSGFDVATGYSGEMTARQYLNRMLFLETVAGVPGMVAGMMRHMRSLRKMDRDHGWIGHLLAEAENERMHLLTFMQMREPKPGMLFRGAVLAGQAVAVNLYTVMYFLFPDACHKAVGYLEEEAVHTYTRAIADLEAGKLPEWSNAPAPPIAIAYWRLAPDAKVKDLLLAVRADEAIHRDVNHVLADTKPDQDLPFAH